MRTWIVADAHGGTDPDADQALIALLDRAQEAPVHLLVLGDLFRFWLGPKKHWTDFQASVLGRIQRLRALGGEATLVVGNREFFVEGHRGTVFGSVLTRPAILDLGLPTLVAHGDRLNHRDWSYRAWRRLSRSIGAKGLVHALPRGIALSAASRLEQGMSGTNQRYKTGELPLEALESFGRRAQRMGAARALVGHFHAERTLDVARGVPVTIAPDWLESRRILVVAEDGGLESVDAPQLTKRGSTS